jgi:hypothetical protein
MTVVGTRKCPVENNWYNDLNYNWVVSGRDLKKIPI